MLAVQVARRHRSLFAVICRSSYSTRSPGGHSNVPQHTDLLQRYNDLVALGRIRYDHEQVRVIVRLRSLHHQLDGYAPPAFASSLLDHGSRKNAARTTAEEQSMTPWWSSSEELSPAENHLALVRVKSMSEELANLDTPKGLLLTGPPGSGKSFLVDLWYSGIPTPYKTRKHYNQLVLELYRAVWEETQQRMLRARSSDLPETPHHSSAWNRTVRDQWHHLAKLDLLPTRWLRMRRQGDTALTSSDGQPTIAFVIAKRLILRHWLIVFDEVQLLDISSAGLLADVFSWFWRMGGVVVGTSNKVPDDLYKNGVHRDRLEPFVDAFKARSPVVGIYATQDWRRLKGHATQGRTWFLWGQEVDFEKMLELDSSVAHRGASYSEDTNTVPSNYSQPSSESISVFGRPLHVPWSRNGVCKFTFAQLCEESLGPADYLTLASTYHTMVITDIPLLKLSAKNQARRFISLIDALYEAHCCLICHAEADVEDLFFPDATQGTQPGANDDLMHVETVAEMQDVYRPNVSAYDAPQMNKAPVQSAVLPLDKLTIFSGQDEQFAFKRALSRLIEMASLSYYREGQWNPLPPDSRKWEGKLDIKVMSANTSVASPDAYKSTDLASEGHNNISRPLAQPEAPRLSSDHVWGVRDDWGEKAREWGKGAKAFVDKNCPHQ